MSKVGFQEPPLVDAQKFPIVYHYCSNSVFLSILSKKVIWFSDINTMNDYAEIHWAYDRFIEAANQVYGEVGHEFIDKVDEIVSKAQLSLLPLISSYSKNSDVLSQWKSYSDNGAGVAIGFDTALLKKLSTRNVEIEYSRSAQIAHYRTLLLAGRDVYNECKESDKSEFLFEFSANMHVDMCCFKNSAFEEEGEVRFIRAVSVAAEQSGWKLRDSGGHGNDKVSRKPLEIKFRSRAGGIIAYLEMPLSGLGKNLIKHVVIGPRSECSGVEVSMALTAAGYENVKISKSSATYR